MTHQGPTTTIAILGGGMVVDKARALPLEGKGFGTTIFKGSPTNLVDEPAPTGERDSPPEV